MAPTKRKTKHKPGKTKVGEEVLDLVISYINNVEDRNSVSLVSRKLYEIDGIMRKRLTVHTHYYPNLSRLIKRFPFMEMLKLKGPLSHFNDMRITPWIEQLALDFKYLKELHIRHLVVHDDDLETLSTTCGKDLRSLKIKKCTWFSSDGLMHVSKYCNQLRTFCFRYCYHINVKGGIWLHQLALNSTVLEKFHFKDSHISDVEALIILVKNCCNSLISLKIGDCYLSKLGDAFRYAVRLENFGGNSWDQESELVGFQFPRNIRSLSIQTLSATHYSIVLPFLNHIRKLKLAVYSSDPECQCSLFKRCPNLEVLYTQDICGDMGLQVIGQFCKKLRKLTHNGFVSHVGLIDMAKGCTKLECLKVRLGDISNEALECVGTHLKNLRDFRMWLGKEDSILDLPLDNGVTTMLMGCSKLERLDISLSHRCKYGGLTDVGLEYIGKYGVNLRSLSLTHIGKSDVKGLSGIGVVKLSEGCPRLRKLILMGCPFSKQVGVASSVFNIPSLRYFWGHNSYLNDWALTHPGLYL